MIETRTCYLKYTSFPVVLEKPMAHTSDARPSSSVLLHMESQELVMHSYINSAFPSSAARLSLGPKERCLVLHSCLA